ncbi:hypothetical protein CW693_02810 [Candidatus Bathyarchaeota archaeon]|nr:MAG: hypothetical protein CW693_02810 [Candidatus Bathyarchaeota archaeon]
MSEEEASPWLKAAEKFFGLILLIMGALGVYYTFTSAGALDVYTGFFGFLSAIPIVLGLILLIAKTEE